MRTGTRGKTTRIIIHVLVWAVILVLPVYAARRFRMGNSFLLNYYTFMAINALIFYANYLFLVPGLFFRKLRFMYFLAALALVFCFYFLSEFANNQVISYISKNNNQELLLRPPGGGRTPGPPPGQGGLMRRIFNIPHAQLIGYTSSSIFMVILSLGLRVLERQSKIEKMQGEMEKEMLTAELAFLKNQISPHFLFNTLNNIHSLIGRNNEDSKNAVVKLSKLMRYVLNESGQDNKSISEEIEFMNNYIDLMKLRIGAKTRLNVEFPAECKDVMIPHLLFVSLIENAFKYGISVQQESYINISLRCGVNNILFTCENGLPERDQGISFASHGIGLENLKKRLNLLYPHRHELGIRRTEDKFEVNLFIQL